MQYKNSFFFVKAYVLSSYGFLAKFTVIVMNFVLRRAEIQL